MSESRVRRYLAKRGFSEADAEDAIALAREWATTFTRTAG
jgi:SOS response regulatory protein OraA/RecX